MFNNENLASNNISNTNDINFSFAKSDKMNAKRKNEKDFLSNKNCINNDKNNLKEISLLLVDYSNQSTEKLKFATCQDNNSPHKSNKKIKKQMCENKNKNVFKYGQKQNNIQLFRNYEFIIKRNKHGNKEEIKKLFKVQQKELIYEIEYFLNNPCINYDMDHQNDNNSNFQYINENFIDILLLSFRNKLILNSTIKPMNSIQNEITFPKRNILISWLTEIDMKYIKNQSILFMAVKYLDRILYHQKIDINEFQLIGILCFNLALKLENSHKVFLLNEVMSLIGSGELTDYKTENKLIKKIKKTEMKICDILNFDLIECTCVMILHRLIQLFNIKNKEVENIFKSISYFFLELSLYDEQFYSYDEFLKAFSSVIFAKLILKEFNIKIGFHNYLKQCAKNRGDEIKKYGKLCQKTLKELKHLKYGRTLFNKYQMKNFQCVLNTYLSGFINNCFR